MQAGKKHGMQTLTDALYQLYMTRQVSLEECLRVAPDQNEFRRAIGEPLPGEEGAAAGRR
jgi:twitching motility protein PilT